VPTTQPKTRPSSPDDEAQDAFWQAWDEFFAALRRARSRAARTQADGLTLSQYNLLLAVADSPMARCGDLADQVGASAPTVTRMLTALEDGGVIRRQRAAGDRRAVCVELTDKGRLLLETKRTVVSQKRQALYETLTATERRQAERLFRRFAEAFEVL
jgi:DNA-binding MarR family transcriptional regulator